MSKPGIQILSARNLLLFFGVLSLFVGVVMRNAALLALGTMCVAVLVQGVLYAHGLLGGVNALRTHHAKAFQGNSLAVSLKITGTDRKAPELVLVEDHFPPGTASKVRRLLGTPLSHGRLVEINYMGHCDHRRGMYILGPVKVDAWDPCGLFRREVMIDQLTKLLVYPMAVDLATTRVLGEGVLPHVGLELTNRSGVSQEFQGIREYRPGDPQRLIHWRSTARHGRPMVKEFQEEITTLVTLALDLGRQGLVGIGDQTSVEYGIRCCASLAKRTVELGHRLQFYGIGDTVEHLPQGGGVPHLLGILDRLAFVRPKGDSAFSAVLADLSRDFPTGSTLIAILGATTLDLDSMERVVDILIHRRVLPIFILIDDRAFIKIYSDQEVRHVKALPLEEVEKRLVLRGARVHIIKRSKTIESALIQGLERELYEAPR